MALSSTNGQPLTGSLAQAGVLSRVTPRRILEVRLPSEPYRYPRLSPSCQNVSSKQCANAIIERYLEIIR